MKNTDLGLKAWSLPFPLSLRNAGRGSSLIPSQTGWPTAQVSGCIREICGSFAIKLKTLLVVLSLRLCFLSAVGFSKCNWWMQRDRQSVSLAKAKWNLFSVQYVILCSTNINGQQQAIDISSQHNMRKQSTYHHRNRIHSRCMVWQLNRMWVGAWREEFRVLIAKQRGKVHNICDWMLLLLFDSENLLPRPEIYYWCFRLLKSILCSYCIITIMCCSSKECTTQQN